MSHVVINVLAVPEGRGDVLEQRFAARAGAVEKAPGFEHFALLRPVEGTDKYLVYTRWRSKADFEAWLHRDRSDGATASHANGRADGGGAPAPVSASDGVWSFEVATEAGPPA